MPFIFRAYFQRPKKSSQTKSSVVVLPHPNLKRLCLLKMMWSPSCIVTLLWYVCFSLTTLICLSFHMRVDSLSFGSTSGYFGRSLEAERRFILGAWARWQVIICAFLYLLYFHLGQLPLILALVRTLCINYIT